MKLLKLALKRETAAPILALAFATCICAVLVVARIVFPGTIAHPIFLVWNLFLAWVPLAFSLLACDHYHNRPAPGWRFAAFAGVWLIFFPNAPYICTDIVHLKAYYQHFWGDLMLVLLCALTGLVLGFVSLFLMQALVRRALGELGSWLFIAMMAVFSGVGVYVGRVLRYNSWDVLVQPLSVYRGIDDWVAGPRTGITSFTFPALFATFFFIAYIMLYALTQLRHFQPADTVPSPQLA